MGSTCISLVRKLVLKDTRAGVSNDMDFTILPTLASPRNHLVSKTISIRMYVIAYAILDLLVRLNTNFIVKETAKNINYINLSLM